MTKDEPNPKWAADLGAVAEARRQRDSAHNVNPDPVRIAIEGALWGSIRARGFRGARLQPQSA